MSDSFNDAPDNINQKKAVINWNEDTYSPVADVDGKQPYYTYQGIGNITGTPSTLTSVVHFGVSVRHKGTQVKFEA